MSSQNQRAPISLYNVIVTLVCITLVTLLLKECGEPQITSSDLERVVDSVAFRERVANDHVEKLSIVIADQDSIIQHLQQRKEVTKTIYRDKVRVVKDSLTAAPPECEPLRKQVLSLMELAGEYEAQSDSIIAAHEIVSQSKDSIIAIKDKLYSEMKVSFMEAVRAADQNQALAVKYKKRSKRERLLFAGAAIVGGFFIMKK